MNGLIIKAGASRPRYLRWIDFIATLLLWAGYLYLLKDAFSYVAHRVVDLAAGVSVKDSGGIAAILRSLTSYAEVAVANSAIFIAWALYNKWMYGGRNRRKSADPVKAEEIGAFFGLTAEQVDECRRARRLIVRHDRTGIIRDFQADPTILAD